MDKTLVRFRDGSIWRVFDGECLGGCDNHADERYHMTYTEAQAWLARLNEKYKPYPQYHFESDAEVNARHQKAFAVLNKAYQEIVK